MAHDTMIRLKSPSPAGWMLLGLTALACVLRFWGLNFGLPFAESRPDEMLIISKAFRYGTGDLNPHWFRYPSLFSYVTFAAFGGYAGVLFVAGKIHAAQDLVIRFVEDPTPFFLIVRGLSAFAGALTVSALFVIARRIYGTLTALVAGLLLAVAYIHVRHSHFGVTDIPMTLLTTGSVFFAWRVFREGRFRDYILAGLLAGFATATKYNAALVIVALVVAHVLRAKLQWRIVLDRRLWGAGVVMFGAFALSSPFVLLDWRTAWSDIGLDTAEIAAATVGQFERGWLRHLFFSLWHGVGPVVLFLAAAGIVAGLARCWRETLVILAFPATYYLVMGAGYANFVRHIVPVVPFVCLFAGWALGSLVTHGESVGPRWRWPVRAVIIALCLAGVFPTVTRSVALDRLLGREDTRSMAAHYVMEQLPVGGRLGFIGTRYGMPHLPESAASIEAELAQAPTVGRQLLQARLEVARKRPTGLSVEHLEWESLVGQTNLPDDVLVEYYPIPYSLDCFGRSEELLREMGYVQVAEFKGAERSVLNGPQVAFDSQDSFYVPFRGLSRVSNPGPSLTLWSRRDRPSQ